MASNTIKGLTVEIGGDTTQLGKALDNVEKKTKSLSSELGQINKLLKLDPKNVDLLAQKQKVLASAVSNTKEKLETLKEAEKQVQKQFEKGEASEEQVRALQREIIATTKKLEGYENAAKETAKEIEDLGKKGKKAKKGSEEAAEGLDELADSADKAGESSDGLGSKLGSLAKGGLKVLAAGVTAAIGALVASAEATREYRTEMGKLDTAFKTAGHSSQTATATYKTLQGVIGETDQAVEASQQIALLASSEKDAAEWASYAAGVVGRFGDALQPETFFEAANETLKLGEATGAFTQMLEGTGYSVDQFNMGLAQCSTEQEKQQYMLSITKMQLGEAATAYSNTNAEVIRANQANEEWTATMAEAGAAIEPILTDVKLLGASLLADLMPGITDVAEGFRAMFNGDAGGAEQVGASLAKIVEQLLSTITAALPAVTTMAVSLITSLATTLIGMLPQLVDTGIEIILALLKGVTSAIPKIVTAVVKVIPQLAKALVKGIPKLLEGVMQAITTLVAMLAEQLPVLIPALIDALGAIITMLIEQLPVIVPQLLNAVISLVTLLVGQLPVLIPMVVNMVVQLIQLLSEQLTTLVPQLAEALVTLITILVEQLPVIIPMLIEACITIVMAIIQALPSILTALTDALPAILAAVWDAIVMIFENLPQWFEQIFTGAVELIKAAWDVVAGFFSGIWDAICEIFAPVGDWFAGIFSGAWEGIKSAWSGVTAFFSGIWTGITDAFAAVGTFFKDIFTGAWNAVKNVFSGVSSFFLGIWDKIKNAFSAIGVKIGDAISGAVKGAINGLLSIVEKTVNGFLKMINGAIGIINGIPGVNIKKLKMVEFTRLAEGTVVDKPTPAIFGEDGAEAVVPLERHTEWIQRVAQEFLGHVKDEAGMNVLSSSTDSGGATAADNWMREKMDKILDAIERGQILTIDGAALVGATATQMDNALGLRRTLAARGAI
jgi:phage-related protein